MGRARELGGHRPGPPPPRTHALDGQHTLRRRPSQAPRAVLGPALAALLAFATVAQAEPRVVATIAPLHSLVASVMAGVGDPVLLIRGYASPHAYQLRPSDANALEDADLVLWIGPVVETFLYRAIRNLARGRLITVMELEGLTLLPVRAGGTWDEHAHTDDAARMSTATVNGHLWLDPGNAKRIVEAAAEALASIDPGREARYRDNAERVTASLEALDRELAAALGPVRDVPYVVFHDAYAYLEARYGLTAVGAVAVSPDRLPSAQRVRALRARIAKLGARCVFREPQFESALVRAIVEGTGARVGVLDPLGASLEPGPELYFELMRTNVRALVECLGG